MPFVPLTQGSRPQESAAAISADAAPARFVPLGQAAQVGPVQTAEQTDPGSGRTWGEAAVDTGIDLAKGVVGLGESVVGLGDLATGNLLGKGLGAIGYDPGRTKEMLSSGYSESRRAANKAVQDADGFWDTTMALVSNPSAAAGSIVESAPLMLGSAAAARALAARMLASRGIAAGTEAAAKFLSQPAVVAKLTAASVGTEGALTAGSIQETGRQEGRDYTSTVGPALAAGVTTAGIGFATSKLPGFRDIEAKAATVGMGAGKGAGAAAAAKALAKDTFKEGVLEELPQSAQEQVWQNIALGKPWNEGVPEAAAQGMVAGAGMGGGMSAYSSGVEALREGNEAPATAAPAAPGAAGALPDTERAATDEAVAALMRPPVESTALDRVQAIDAEIAAAAPDTDTAALQAERAALAKDWPTVTPGASTRFSTETGAQLEGQYALIEADDLQPSHDTELRPNPAYPQSLQPRQRDRAASATQIQSIVGRLDPARLGESATAADGAPIIGADGLVESGNARTIALRRVYAAGGLKAQQYRTWLAENADRFGLAPEHVDSLRRPVLVRVRSTPVNRAEFARQANASTVAAMSPREQALADSARIDTLDDLMPTEQGEFASSRDFIRRFVGALPDTERGAMVDADGALSASGYARVRNAVLAKAYGDSPVLTRLVESMDDAGRNLARAFVIAAPRVAQARAMMQAGRRHDADITPALVEAASEFDSLRRAGKSVDDALNQQSFAGQERSPEAAKLLRFMADNARRPRRIADLLGAYADALDAAGDPAQAGMFGDAAPPTAGALLDGALREVGRDAAPAAQQDAAAPDKATPSAQPDAAAPGAAAPARQAANEPAGPDWVQFAPESGTRGIPRAQMPQVRMKDRGAMVNFLKARGIEHEIVEVDPAGLKPTQAEFSRGKVLKAMGAEGDTATALVSFDGYVIDGHHRWLAQRVKGQPLRALRFNAPAEQVLAAIHQFPGTRTSSDSAIDERRAAVQDFKAAMADLADFLTRYQRAAIVQEHTPEMHRLLVNLFDKGAKLVGTEVRRLMAWVRAQLKADPETKKSWNKITAEEYRAAALEALERGAQDGGQMGLFDTDAAATEAMQGDLFAGGPAAQPALDGGTAARSDSPPAPAVAVIDGRPYELARDNFKIPALNEVLPAPEVEAAEDAVAQFFKDREKVALSPEDRARAEALLAPRLGMAAAEKVGYDQKIIDIVKRTGALGQRLAPLKSLGRAAEKLVVDENFNVDGMKDLLRSTIVIRDFSQAAAVVEELRREFQIMRVIDRAEAGLAGDKVSAKPRSMFSGYADVLVNVVMPNGTIAEIQINVPEMLAAKEGAKGDGPGHKLYEAQRDSKKGDAVWAGTDRAMQRLYGAAFAVLGGASRTQMPSSGPRVIRGQGDSDLPSSENLNQEPSGNRTNSSPPNVGTNTEPSGNLSGIGFTASGLSSSRSDSTIRSGSQQYNQVEPQGGGDEPAENARPGAQGPRAEVPGGTEGSGPAHAVSPGDGRPDPGRDRPVGDGQEDAGAAVHGEGAGDKRRDRRRARNRTQRGDSQPAGREIAPKSGLNYRFADDDISPPGSWAKRAEWNVEAVELVRRLEAEKRQATPEEQTALARWVGWGASELAQKLFGDWAATQREALSHYESAVAAMSERGNRPLPRVDQYGRQTPGFYAAFRVLAARNPALDYYQVGEITREDLDKAAPSKADRRWLDLHDRLKKAMTADEWAEAARSTQYGHYTSAPIVRGMWGALERFGFKGGLVFEPGAGKGNFPGLMPDALAANSAYTGIEYDSITGAILKHLFPDERVLVESFIDSKLPRDFYDVAVGNPPFGDIPILSDREYRERGFKLHDYFFAKTIDRVRPGGLLVFVTSRYTMDKKSDAARKYLAERADLVGAIRLPQTAFKENAGTEVVTDVLFLRKKVPGQPFDGAQSWADAVETKVGDQAVAVNEYFVAHPEMILGQQAMAGAMYSKNEYTVLPDEGDIGARFNEAVGRMPADIFAPPVEAAAHAARVRDLDFNPKAKKDGNYYLSDAGVLMQREAGQGLPVDRMSKAQREIVSDFIPLRDALKQAQHDQLNGGDWEASLAALQGAYKAFVAKHGRLLQSRTQRRRVKVDVLDENGDPTGEREWDEEEVRVFPLQSLLADDPDSTLVLALESVNDETGEVSEGASLRERVLGAKPPQRITTPHDAMLAVIAETGRVDVPAIGERMDMTDAEVVEALGASIYRNPEGGQWETADEYLSGNVKAKLVRAQEAAQQDKRFARNVEALTAVQPQPKGPDEINIGLGMNWIPGEVYQDFMKEIVGMDVTVAFNDATRQWSVTTESGARGEFGLYRYRNRVGVYKTRAGAEKAAAAKGGEERGWTVRALDQDLATATRVDWGTEHKPADKILEHALTGRPIVITQRVSTGESEKTIRLDAEMEAANEKLNAMRQRFAEWAWQDAERTARIVTLYNDTFNTNVPRKFDGSFLTLPGSSDTIQVYDHVKRGAWRIVQTGNTYLAHAVGSGKTWASVISAMEQRRLGLINKPMFVVPNHMLQQFAAEWLQLYPAARIAVADETNFTGETRRRFVSRVALSDLDGIIITHDAFKRLDLDPAFTARMVQEQIDQLTAAMEAMQDAEGGGGKGRPSPRVKQIQNRIQKLEERLKARIDAGTKDRNVRFDEMGVDMLYIDEAHVARKLDIATSRQVKGIATEGSQLAMNLYMAARYLDEKRPGRSIVMMSGTPVTNTLGELFTVQKFMNGRMLKERGIDDFDSWAAMFGRENTALEVNAAGKYEPVTRFTKFVNVPELTQMFRDFADVLDADHLAQILGDKRPKVDGGARKIIVTPKTAAYAEYQKVLEARYEASRAWKPSRDEPNNPDPLIAIIGDGRLAAIDMRFIDPSRPSDPDSKLNRMIDDVIAEYKATAEIEYKDKKTDAVEPNKGSAMMVFSDLGFGQGVAAHRGFSGRAWFEKRLRDAGIPPAHVAFMEDYKKSYEKVKLFRAVNSGAVRILVGSSKNMGTGVNAQQRLKTLFHLDVPWFPADLEQREGRAVRQGNKNPVVRLLAYAAKGSYDQQMWQLVAGKQAFIDAALSGDETIRELDDLSAVGQAEMAAGMVADDPRVIQLAGLRADIDRLNRLFQAHETQRARFMSEFAGAEREIEALRKLLPQAEAAAAAIPDLSGDKFRAIAGGKTYAVRKDWVQALKQRASELAAAAAPSHTIGEIGGLPVRFQSYKTDATYEWVVGVQRADRGVAGDDPLFSTAAGDDTGIAMRAVNAAVDVARAPARIRDRISQLGAQRDALQPRLDARFPMLDMLAGKRREAADLEREIAGPPLATDAEIEEASMGAALGLIPEPGEFRLSRGSGAGRMPAADVRAVVERIRRDYAGLPPVVVLPSATDPATPPALAQFIRDRGAVADVEGAFHDGKIYLFASGLSDAARAEHVLAEHEAAHAGLAAILGAGRKAAMQSLYNLNPALRRRVKPAVDAGMSIAEAVEEAIVDMPSAELVRLRGWRGVVDKVRAWLSRRGFSALAARLDGWLAGHLTEQQRADMFVADLVREARAVARGRSAARDAAEQSQWLERQARARGFADVEAFLAGDYDGFAEVAREWREQRPAEALLSRAWHGSGALFGRFAADQKRAGTSDSVHGFGWGAYFASMKEVAEHYRKTGSKTVVKFRGKVVDTMKSGSVYWSKYSPNDDAPTIAQVVNDMARLIQEDTEYSAGGGNSFAQAHGRLMSTYRRNKADAQDERADRYYGEAIRLLSTVRPGDVTTSLGVTYQVEIPDDDGRYIAWEKPMSAQSQAVRDAFAYLGVPVGDEKSDPPTTGPARGATMQTPYQSGADGYRALSKMLGSAEAASRALWSRGVPGTKYLDVTFGARDMGHNFVVFDPSAVKIVGVERATRLSRARIAAAPATADAATRAELLIQTSASTPRPLDAAFRLAAKVTGLERVASIAYGMGGRLIDRIVPERVKAGVVSDYGIPQAVLDRRGAFQGSLRGQMLQAGALVDKLATLTRAESRVAYEWMTGEDTRTADELMADLPAESVRVLNEVRNLIDRLSDEAIALKQLDPEARDRHRFAYLRRSYFKHAADLTAADKQTRGRAIAILGEQYRGRGMTRGAPMKQIQQAAPEWWKRKFQAGRADTSLKGEKFIRLERRAPTGAGVAPLPGVESERRPGRLLEVHFWPAGESMPAKYADWENAGTWEAVDTKGGDVVMWRDFTKAERERMGEIDEARYAIARTLRNMIHDIEVGKYLQWLAQTQAKKPGETLDGPVVKASERYLDTFKAGEWVEVPDTKIAGTNVPRYGDLAGRYLPGPIWNDVRQIGNRPMPLGHTYNAILRAWKTSKTAMSPAVHMNNIMSNVVMSDWHDVTAGHVAKALQILLAANDARKGAIGAAGRLAGKMIGIADVEAAREIVQRYEASGGSIGGWVSQEIAAETMDHVRELLRAEVDAAAATQGRGQVGVFAAMQAVMQGKLPAAYEALRGNKAVGFVATDARNLIDLYQAEDDVFRLAAWLRAKEQGRTDVEAGRVARRSFLDYSINAPWIAGMRATGWPFISYTYRAVPMLLEIAGTKPHKLFKLMAMAGALNALGVMLAGGDGDDEDRNRRLLPEEKAGKVWGIVPKMIRMPWNDAHDSPVYLDIRRWIPVGDVLDLGQGHSVVPVPPALMPGGPLAVMFEIVQNKSMFTGKEISNRDTDTLIEQAKKAADHLWKAAMPNIIGVPGTYATEGVVGSMTGRTDAFGRELSPAQALLGSVGIKVGSYPTDVLTSNLGARAAGVQSDLDREISALRRQLATQRIDQDEFDAKAAVIVEKKRRVAEELREKLN